MAKLPEGGTLTLARVVKRVRLGGHNVPEEDVRQRLTRSVQNFFQHYRELVDSWTIFDNRGESPVIIAYVEYGQMQVIHADRYLALVKLGGSHD